MIDRLRIRHFKSIRELDMDCSKVNVFIGEPNTGKSNILESLGLASWMAVSDKSNLHEFIRFRTLQNLFFDDEVDTDVQIDIGNINIVVSFKDNNFTIKLIKTHSPTSEIILDYHGKKKNHMGNHDQRIKNIIDFIRFFRFSRLFEKKEELSDHLMPPDGGNIVPLILSNRYYKSFISDILKRYGFYLVLKPQDGRMEFQKNIDGIIYSYPFELLSDTLQRMIFFTLAMDSSKDSTLIFEEPESHAFPYYTKYLGEKIGRDPTNQYFIATHNPYLLNSIIEKTPKDSIRIFLTYYDNYETKVKQLSSDEVEEVLTYDPFLNLDHFLEEGKK
ncbi:hypothetical protein B6U90_04670 [Thermoplasmatales archaeon ex4484_6]|nr:MAG: hypothetical protein B6U90_04670 [Thermoplasmatales archaeon ex4484_6]